MSFRIKRGITLALGQRADAIFICILNDFFVVKKQNMDFSLIWNYKILKNTNEKQINYTYCVKILTN